VESSVPDVSETVSLLLTVFSAAGLAAACGIRVFLPFLVLSLAALFGKVELVDSFHWIATRPAAILFGVLALVEIVGYHSRSPRLRLTYGRSWSTVLAVAAGALIATALLVDLQPSLCWGVGLVAGGLVTATIQRPTSALRVLTPAPDPSSDSTGPVNTPAGETASALLISILSLCAPIAAPILVIAVIGGVIHMHRTQRNRAVV
jgi:hypothetical protein